MLRVCILGFPHTATTFIYKYVLGRMRGRVRGVLGVFEPFNSEVVRWCASGDVVHHYSEGEVRHDLLRLPKRVRDLIIENAKWFDEWVRCDIPRLPFCGLHFHRIFEELDAVGDVVVKDVVAWVRAGELVDKFPRTLFIFPIRDRQRVLNSFRKLRRVHIERGETAKLHPRWMLGLGLFYRYFRGMLSYRDVPMGAMFEETWRRYVGIARDLAGRRNVVTLEFGERLSPQEIDDALRLVDEL